MNAAAKLTACENAIRAFNADMDRGPFDCLADIVTALNGGDNERGALLLMRGPDDAPLILTAPGQSVVTATDMARTITRVADILGECEAELRDDSPISGADAVDILGRIFDVLNPGARGVQS
jgi:hypothetical protein